MKQENIDWLMESTRICGFIAILGFGTIQTVSLFEKQMYFLMLIVFFGTIWALIGFTVDVHQSRTRWNEHLCGEKQ